LSAAETAGVFLSGSKDPHFTVLTICQGGRRLTGRGMNIGFFFREAQPFFYIRGLAVHKNK
jgi:hypothetical protein